MSAKTDSIELDQAIAATLKTRAAERGVSVSQLVADLVSRESAPAPAGSHDIAELDRRWAAVKAGQATVPHADVVRWLDSWGTPAFKAWPSR